MNINLVNKDKIYNFDIPPNASLKYIYNLAFKLLNSDSAVFDIKYKNIKFSDYPKNKLFTELISEEDSIIYLTIIEKESVTSTSTFPSEKYTGREKNNNSKIEINISPKIIYNKNIAQNNRIIYKPLQFNNIPLKKSIQKKIGKKIFLNNKKLNKTKFENKVFGKDYDKKEEEILSLLKTLSEIVKEKDNYLYKKKLKIIKTDGDELSILEKKIKDFQDKRIRYIKKLINDLNKNEIENNLGEDYLLKFYKDIDNYVNDDNDAKKNTSQRSSIKPCASVDNITINTNNNDLMNNKLVLKNDEKTENSIKDFLKINKNIINLKKNLQKNNSVIKQNHNLTILNKCIERSNTYNKDYKLNKSNNFYLKSSTLSQNEQEQEKNDVNNNSNENCSNSNSVYLTEKKSKVENNNLNSILKTENSANKNTKTILPLLNINNVKSSKEIFLFENNNHSKENNIINTEINEHHKKKIHFADRKKNKSRNQNLLNDNISLELIDETDSENSNRKIKNKISLTKDYNNENKEKLFFSDEKDKKKCKKLKLFGSNNEENDNDIKKQQEKKNASKKTESFTKEDDNYNIPQNYYFKKRGYSMYYKEKCNKAIQLYSNNHFLNVSNQNKEDENKEKNEKLNNDENNNDNNIKNTTNNISEMYFTRIANNYKLKRKKRRHDIIDTKFDFII